MAFGEDNLPSPLLHLTSITDRDAHSAALHAAYSRLETAPPRELFGWGIALLTADVRIEAFAIGPNYDTDYRSATRIHAVRREADGWVATQLPYRDNADSAQIQVTHCRAEDLANAVVAALPSPPTRPQHTSPTEKPPHTDDTPIRQGYINVGRGISYDGQIDFTDPNLLRWTDSPRGRFVTAGRHADPAHTINGDKLAAAINSHIKPIVEAIREERR